MEQPTRLVFFSEDDPMMLRMFERVFRLSGFDVETASDGEEAIAKFCHSPKKPSVIVLDVMMPKRSGFEVLEYIKQQPSCKDIPVVMLSNLAGKDDVDRALALGAQEYLIKSQYEPKEIAEKISSIVAEHEAKLSSSEEVAQ